MRIRKATANFVREPLCSPFGFKGHYLNELWNVVVGMESDGGARATGLGVQSVLWSDAEVFGRYSPAASNAVMFLLTEYALRCAERVEFGTPDELFRAVFPKVYRYAKQITGLEGLRATFALNALVPVDMAAWLLYARENGRNSFDDIIPADAARLMGARHGQLAAVPLISYGVPERALQDEIGQGSFFLKIKIGSDPDLDGDPDKMLSWDMRRLTEVHRAAQGARTPYTDSGKVLYYLDANGRYDSRDRLMRLLAHADHIGALPQIILLEEPFPEDAKIDVHDIPVRIAADESAHSDRDVEERIGLGYGAVTLKPIAKTMSMTFAMLRAAGRRGVPCFCADLTVNPLMVDVNKNFAARIPALPGMKIGVLESNGRQNYKNWEALKKAHPAYGGSWIDEEGGVYTLDEEFYRKSGGMFLPCAYYDRLVE